MRFCVTAQEDIVDSASRWKRGLTDVCLWDLYPLLQNYQEVSKNTGLFLDILGDITRKATLRSLEEAIEQSIRL